MSLREDCRGPSSNIITMHAVTVIAIEHRHNPGHETDLPESLLEAGQHCLQYGTAIRRASQLYLALTTPAQKLGKKGRPSAAVTRIKVYEMKRERSEKGGQ